MRAEWNKDRVESKDVRKQKAAERYDHNISKKAKHTAKRDHAEEILCTALVTSVAELEIQLLARPNSSSARVASSRTSSTRASLEKIHEFIPASVLLFVPNSGN
jgi:hypothetical protein